MRRSKRVALAAGLVSLVATLTVVIAGAATAHHGSYPGQAAHVEVGGNPRCPAGTADAGSIKIENNALVAGYNDGRISITARGGNPDAFSWQLVDIHSVDVEAVIVKGGNDAYIYSYTGQDSDAGLTPPLNNGNQAPQISHVEFCFDPKDPGAPDPKLTVQKTASGATRVQHTWEVDKQVKVADASDATYGDNAVLALPDGGEGSFTWKVTVTHSQARVASRHGEDHRDEPERRRGHGCRRHGLDAGRDDRLRRQRAARASRFRRTAPSSARTRWRRARRSPTARRR